MDYTTFPGIDRDQRFHVSKGEILEIVANYYNLEIPAMWEKTRRREILVPRQIAQALLRYYWGDVTIKGGVSLASVGAMTGFNHATILHSYRVVFETFVKDHELKKQLNEIMAIIQNLNISRRLALLNQEINKTKKEIIK